MGLVVMTAQRICLLPVKHKLNPADRQAGRQAGTRRSQK